MAGKLTDQEKAVLTYLSDGTAATHHISRVLGSISDRRTRAFLVALRKRGLVDGLSAGGRVYWYAINEAGRAALSQEEQNG